ncbi:unnamed protein product [Acanthoscelides obtectus]|uniref:RRM domain-containing protein n=1 Tax=Acanthoscelides obtectus TaxID=200917 RepID=A0A9P0LE32_ACAOB|nr:unnamed protein product [Acanthoscelides obtectus]CAK1653278.1 Heterogeneous nuclear ribonucleoprotein H [Acanthoscelides obtectus]
MSGDGDRSEDTGEYIVKLRGLPWSATEEDIEKFFSDCKILGGKEGVHLTASREGRPSGECFVELEDAEDLELALAKDRDHIGNRYIEVFKVNRPEMEWTIKRSGPQSTSEDDGCVRLRGLPFGCSKEEIANFFSGLEIVPNGITLLTFYSGRSSGEAYVQFKNREVAEKALLKHREKIAHRYIEIFRSSLSEVNSMASGFESGGGPGSRGRMGGSLGYNTRPSPYDRGDRYGQGMTGRFQPRSSRSFKGAGYSSDIDSDYGYDRGSMWNGGMRNGKGMGGMRGEMYPDEWSSGPGMGDKMGAMHCVHMRGLPFRANEEDIADFFKPVVPIDIRLLQDSSGRASGEADVEFASHDDAVRAMAKDKGHMQHRSVIIFPNM